MESVEKKQLLVDLSEYAHNAWAGWMEYLFSKSTNNEDGTVTIPKELVVRWKRQMETYYNLLPENEKLSDIKEAEKIILIYEKREQ